MREAPAPGASPPKDLNDEREEVLVPLLAEVRAADSVERIHELLGLDSFMAC
ncbi:MAG: hypothetical protein ACK4YQ_07700 [Phenylobacterium sp.]|uniref:hypothetical protein n=1 Tax=Phenylobacterium sp. TaxID=1871053 RepID=UPI003919F53C